MRWWATRLQRVADHRQNPAHSGSATNVSDREPVTSAVTPFVSSESAMLV